MRCRKKQLSTAFYVPINLLHILIGHSVPTKEYEVLIFRKCFYVRFNRNYIVRAVRRERRGVLVTVIIDVAPAAFVCHIKNEPIGIFGFSVSPFSTSELCPDGAIAKSRISVVKSRNNSEFHLRKPRRALVRFR